MIKITSLNTKDFYISYKMNADNQLIQVSVEFNGWSPNFLYTYQPVLEMNIEYSSSSNTPPTYSINIIQDTKLPSNHISNIFKPQCTIEITDDSQQKYIYKAILTFPDLNFNQITDSSDLFFPDGDIGTANVSVTKEYWYKHLMNFPLNVLIEFLPANPNYQPKIPNYTTSLVSLLFQPDTNNNTYSLISSKSIEAFAFTYQINSSSGAPVFKDWSDFTDPLTKVNQIGGPINWNFKLSAFATDTPNYITNPIDSTQFYVLDSIVPHYNIVSLADIIISKYKNYFDNITKYDPYYSGLSLNNYLSNIFNSINYQIQQYPINEINATSKELETRLVSVQNNLNQNTGTIEDFEKSVSNISKEAKGLFDTYTKMNEINNASKEFYTDFNTNFKEAVAEKVEEVYSSLKFFKDELDIVKKDLESLSFVKRINNIQTDMKELTEIFPSTKELNSLNSNNYIGAIAGLVIGALTVIGIKAYTGNSQTEINNHHKISDLNHLELLDT